MKVALPARRKSRIEMIPLIDIVFLLLVVFIYTMLSMAVHRGMPVALPTSAATEIEKNLVLSVSIEQDGTVYLDEMSASAPAQVHDSVRVLSVVVEDPFGRHLPPDLPA